MRKEGRKELVTACYVDCGGGVGVEVGEGDRSNVQGPANLRFLVVLSQTRRLIAKRTQNLLVSFRIPNHQHKFYK